MSSLDNDISMCTLSNPFPLLIGFVWFVFKQYPLFLRDLQDYVLSIMIYPYHQQFHRRVLRWALC